MRLVLVACTKCGAPKTSPFGECPDCEAQQVAAAVARKRRVRERPVRGRAA
jgi:hypothetical protein